MRGIRGNRVGDDEGAGAGDRGGCLAADDERRRKKKTTEAMTEEETEEKEEERRRRARAEKRRRRSRELFLEVFARRAAGERPDVDAAEPSRTRSLARDRWERRRRVN